MDVRITTADQSHFAAVEALLTSAELPTVDVREHWQNFLVALDGDSLVGAVGLELHGAGGFIRSLVVSPACRNKGVGKLLYDAIVAAARKHGVEHLGLLTFSAEKFFAREGFRRVSREEVPAFIKQTKEFTTLCASTAVPMIKRLT